ncbi:MAG: PDZ domain-containing protein, partial [Gemmatimonadetes bacterium]|nr:PDZ domain-containing protein [Gemmatimonadota bacterium]
PSPLRNLLLSDVRVGGAEFRPLSGDLAEYFDGADEGLLVLRVIRDTPADRMGLKDGDVVVEVDGYKCNHVSVLRDALARAKPGSPANVKWIRKGRTHVGNLDAR